MALKKTRFIKGIILAPDDAAIENIPGELKVDSADSFKIKAYLDGASRELLTNSQSQIVSNKTLLDTSTLIANASDQTRQVKFDASGVSASTTRTLTIPNVSGTIITSADSGTITSSMIANDTIVDADINSGAAISLSKLATGALPSGITVDSSNISNLSIVDADISATAAIALSKLATGALPSGITVDSSNISNLSIVDADISATAAIDASKIGDGSVSTTEFQYLSNVTSDIQTQLSSKAIGAASSLANQIPSFSGTDGKTLQASVATLTTSGSLTNLTALISSGIVTMSGLLTLTSNTSNSQTGSSVNITSTSTTVVRLTGAITSIGGYASGTDGRMTIIINTSGNAITINDEDTSITAANRIRTGTNTSIQLENNGSLMMIYNQTTARHHVISRESGYTSEKSFTLVNNQTSAADITSLIFNPSTYRGFKVEYSIYRETSTVGSGAAQIGQLRGIYNTKLAEWYLSEDFSGNSSGIEFSITSAGQIQYTSSDFDAINGSPSYIGTLKYNIIKTFGA